MADGLQIRTSLLPIEHLEAELLAAPLSSTTAFRSSLVSLDPSLQHDGTSRLWREVELSLLSRFPGISIDELVARRDQCWFASNDGTLETMFDLLAARARQIMDGHGRIGDARHRVAQSIGMPGYTQSADGLRRKWRWLTFALPPDLLLAIMGADADVPSLLSPSLALMLSERGFAEPHLHIGAAIPFDVLWAAVQFELTQYSAKEDMFRSPGAEWHEGNLLGPWLMRASIGRLLLAAFLKAPDRDAGLTAFLKKIQPRLVRQFGVLATHRIFVAINELRNGAFAARSPNFALLRSDLADMSRLKASPTTLSQLNQFRDLDPIGEWYPARPLQSSDFQFTKAAFEYSAHIASKQRQDKLFMHIFWQVVRLRVAYYRHVVQRPMTPGLQWFVRTYARLYAGKRLVAIEALMESALQSAGPGLRSLEFRTQPMAHMSDMTEFVRRVDKFAIRWRGQNSIPGSCCRSVAGELSTNRSSELEFGIVFHFSRSRSKAARKGLPSAWGSNSHSSPEDKANLSGYRYSGFYIENRTSAAALANMLTTFPRTLELVRGVDLCADELGIPLWAMRPLIEHVFNAARRASRLIPVFARPLERPIRATVHAGEDFVHLLSGIRRVGEAVEFIPLGEGDRIGHAVALGIEPSTWASMVQTVPVTLEDRLMDLVWLWRLAMRSSSITELKLWIPWIREQIDVVTHRIFGDERPSSPSELEKFHSALYSTTSLRRAGFPYGPRPVGATSQTTKHVIRWLTDRGLFHRGQMLVEIDVKAEVQLTLAAQQQVRRDIGRLGITVEVNPSSNLLIGHLGSLEQHPLWRLRPPSPADDKTPPVRISIGSDDPLTFATNLPNEYQLVFDAMTESGMSTDECDAWLDAVRKNSLDSRFTIPRSGHDLMIPFSLASSPMIL